MPITPIGYNTVIVQAIYNGKLIGLYVSPDDSRQSIGYNDSCATGYS